MMPGPLELVHKHPGIQIGIPQLCNVGRLVIRLYVHEYFCLKLQEHLEIIPLT